MLRRLVAIGATITAFSGLSACAKFSPDAGMDAVGDIAAHELKKDVAAIRPPDEAVAAATAVRRLLGRTLTADTAVQIALLNNRGLQAAYNDLAIADAQRVGESLPPNPTISVTRIAGSAELEIDRSIVADVIAMATLPARSEIAATRFRRAQLRAAEETLRVANETRRAFYRTVAARELVGFLAQSQEAADSAT